MSKNYTFNINCRVTSERGKIYPGKIAPEKYPDVFASLNLLKIPAKSSDVMSRVDFTVCNAEDDGCEFHTLPVPFTRKGEEKYPLNNRPWTEFLIKKDKRYHLTTLQQCIELFPEYLPLSFVEERKKNDSMALDLTDLMREYRNEDHSTYTVNVTFKFNYDLKVNCNLTSVPLYRIHSRKEYYGECFALDLLGIPWHPDHLMATVEFYSSGDCDSSHDLSSNGNSGFVPFTRDKESKCIEKNSLWKEFLISKDKNIEQCIQNYSIFPHILPIPFISGKKTLDSVKLDVSHLMNEYREEQNGIYTIKIVCEQTLSYSYNENNISFQEMLSRLIKKEPIIL